ncbi:MAG: hypothetical protein KDI61_01710 [Alphaproteobacteria bacterium]|nr:hypothetical protein [Alphaproteobacteria bacterium]
MTDIKAIQIALGEHFRSPVTVRTLEAAGRSKTVVRAKHAGVYLAHQDGHGNDEIARAFGYEDGHSVSNIFSRVKAKVEEDSSFRQDLLDLAEKLSIHCDL